MRRLIPILLLLAACAMAQTTGRPGMSYETEAAPVSSGAAQPTLEIRRIQGVAEDRLGMPIPRVGLGLFADTPDHRFLALVTTDEKGKFDFGKQIPDGRYRLVAKYPGLCTANIPIVVERHASGKKIVLRMQYPGLDVCSYARLK